MNLDDVQQPNHRQLMIIAALRGTVGMQFRCWLLGY
jgi:hypothetical protein